jgi:hypothetical protein
MANISIVKLSLLIFLSQAIPMNITYQLISGSDSWFRCDALKQEGSSVLLSPSMFCAVWSKQIEGANWIWFGQNQYIGNSTFFKYFFIPGIVINITASIQADDRFTLYLNTVQTNCLANYGTFGAGNMLTCDITSYAKTGMNLLRIDVRNIQGCAGLLYLIIVNSYLI